MTRKQSVMVGVAVVLAFLVGFGWQYLRARALAGDLAGARRALVFEQLESTLGAAAIEAQQGSFEAARQFASDFFTKLQAEIAAAPGESRAELQSILAQRDALITALSRNDPATGDLLPRLFVRYRTAMEGLDAAFPMVEPSGPVRSTDTVAP